ncbi:MAG TPA: hypothetical protein VIK18_01525, partial [Pirellulales bacterium]
RSAAATAAIWAGRRPASDLIPFKPAAGSDVVAWPRSIPGSRDASPIDAARGTRKPIARRLRIIIRTGKTELRS